jgi:hypothetical protein
VPNGEMIDFFAEKARNGDAGFAIAFAMLSHSRAIDALREDLCFGSHPGVPGVIEKIAMELHDLVEAVQDMAPPD